MAGPIFLARYPGRCGGCGEDFDEGDELRYDDDDVLVLVGCCDDNCTERDSGMGFEP